MGGFGKNGWWHSKKYPTCGNPEWKKKKEREDKARADEKQKKLDV